MKFTALVLRQAQLVQLLPANFRHTARFLDAIWLFMSKCAHQEWENQLKWTRYKKVLRQRGRQKPGILSEHAGEELERIRDAAIALFKTLIESGVYSRDLLDSALKEVVDFRMFERVFRCEHNTVSFLPNSTPHLNQLGHLLWHLIDAIDPNQTEPDSKKKSLLAATGKGRPKEDHKAQLVRRIGREYRLALGRVPTEKEMGNFFGILFGEGVTFERAIKNWHTGANKNLLESEKYLNNLE